MAEVIGLSGDLSEPIQLILAGEPPLAIRKFFPSFKEAVRFYSGVRGKQFGMGAATEKCCGCQEPAGDVAAELQWAASFSSNSIGRAILILLGMLVHVHFGSKVEWIGFSTFHGFCPSCWSRYRRIRWVKGFLEAITLVMIFGGIAFAAGFCTAIFVMDRLTSTDRMEVWFATAGCVALALAGMLIRIAYRQMGVPASIRSIAPRPFQLMATLLMQKITLPGSPSRSVHVPRYRKANPQAMTWQQTLGVLVTLFGGVPALFLAFSAGMNKGERQLGYEAIAGWVVAVVVLTIWHKKRQRTVRDAYYAAVAEQLRSE